MNWQKTVMRGRDILKITKDQEQGCSGVPLFLVRLAEAQAKITGAIAYKAGIKKVVEYVKKHYPNLSLSDLDAKFEEKNDT